MRIAMRSSAVWVPALLSLLVFTAPLAAAGPRLEEGTAKGSLVVGGKATPLSHAYARAERNLLDKSKEKVRVILSDVALPVGEFLEQFPGLRQAAQGKAQVVTVVLEDAKTVGQGAVLHAAFAAMDGFAGSDTPRFTAKSFDGRLVEGTLATAAPQRLQGTSVEYQASFRAAVWRRPAPTATGAAGEEMAPGKAALAFVTAVASGGVAATRRLLAPDTEAAKALGGPQAKRVLETLASVNPKPAEARLASLWVVGDTAEVTISGKAADKATSHTLLLRRVGAEWRVAQDMTEPWF